MTQTTQTPLLAGLPAASPQLLAVELEALRRLGWMTFCAGIGFIASLWSVSTSNWYLYWVTGCGYLVTGLATVNVANAKARITPVTALFLNVVSAVDSVCSAALAIAYIALGLNNSMVTGALVIFPMLAVFCTLAASITCTWSALKLRKVRAMANVTAVASTSPPTVVIGQVTYEQLPFEAQCEPTFGQQAAETYPAPSQSQPKQI